MDKKVSVIVPVFHVAPYLKKCVTSILKQTYENLEIILVDDGGDDECPAICDCFAEKDPRVRCIHKENGGQSFARKTGVEQATGDYFLFVDADDWIEPDTAEKSLRAALEHDADVVCFGYKRAYKENTFLTPVFPNTKAPKVWTKGEIPELQRRFVGLAGEELAHVEAADRLAPMWGKLYHRDVVLAGKWVSEREVGSSEDAVFNLYALSACKKFVYINEFLYCYRKDNEQATTRRYRKNLVSQWEKLFSYFREFSQQSENADRCLEALDNRIALGMLGIGLNELSNPEGFFKKAKNLRNILNQPMWRKAYAQLQFQYFPLKWKVFFLLCKWKMTEFLLLALWLIARLKTKVAA